MSMPNKFKGQLDPALLIQTVLEIGSIHMIISLSKDGTRALFLDRNIIENLFTFEISFHRLS